MLGVVTGDDFEQAAFAYGVVPFVQLGKEMLHLIGRHVGKEAQTSGVDTYDGDACITYAVCCLEEGAVAT